MATGRWHPALVMDVQVLVTHADRVTLMAREMGHPPRLIRGLDLCDLFQARDDARLPGVVDRWAAYGIAAQVVLIPPPEGPSTRDRQPTLSSRSARAGRAPHTPVAGLARTTGPRLAPPTPGETR